jgi:hypothetical protein
MIKNAQRDPNSLIMQSGMMRGMVPLKVDCKCHCFVLPEFSVHCTSDDDERSKEYLKG